MANAPTWHVVPGSVRDDTQLDPMGNGITDVKTVQYQIDSGPARGSYGKVTVPASDFTADSVSEAIRDAVQAHHDVANLSG